MACGSLLHPAHLCADADCLRRRFYVFSCVLVVYVAFLCAYYAASLGLCQAIKISQLDLYEPLRYVKFSIK